MVAVNLIKRLFRYKWTLSTMTSKSENGGYSWGTFVQKLFKQKKFTKVKVKKSVNGYHYSPERYSISGTLFSGMELATEHN